jgi:hypothetical protein
LLDHHSIESFHCGEHRFEAIAPDDGQDWLATVASEYSALRTRCALPLEDVSLDGITVVGVEHLRARLRSATIPAYSAGNFGIVRSDFGETLCYMLLEQSYGTRFGYKGVRDRELINLPGRGIDSITAMIP